MPSLSKEELQVYNKIGAKIFIESGTFFGHTVDIARTIFDEVYSIELSTYYYTLAKERFKDIKNVKLIEGDSQNVLNVLCHIIDAPVFFWLDGHWSGGNTARGSVDCPLIQELTSINNIFKERCVIAIDDVRLFDTYITEDWQGITREKILDTVATRLESFCYYPSCLYEQDRMIICLKEL